MNFPIGMVVLVCQHDAIEGSARVVKHLKNGNVRVESTKGKEHSYWHTLQFRDSDGYRAGGDTWSRTYIVDPASSHGKEMLAKRHRRHVASKLEALAAQFKAGHLSSDAVAAIEDLVARFA